MIATTTELADICQKYPRPIHWEDMMAENVRPTTPNRDNWNTGTAGMYFGPTTIGIARGAQMAAAIAVAIIRNGRYSNAFRWTGQASSGPSFTTRADSTDDAARGMTRITPSSDMEN